MTVSVVKRFTKDPDSVLDYVMDWSDWLGATDTISVSTWAADAGITIDSNTNSTTTATVWLSGGTVRRKYIVTNSIETNEGRSVDRSILVRCIEK